MDQRKSLEMTFGTVAGILGIVVSVALFTTELMA